MSSAGQAVGGIVGGIAGFFLGGGPTGALYGAQIGMMLGGLVDPPKGPSVHGPRLDDLSVQTSTYGANIPRVYGTVGIAGNIFWLEGDKIRERKKRTSGGKGGGTTTTTYKYFATFAVGLCEGPIVGIRRMWIGGNLVYDGAAPTTAGVIKSGKSKSTWQLYTGTDDQQPDPRYQADKGIDATSGFPGLAYIVFYDLPLDKYGNSLAGAQVKVEVVTAGSTSYAALTSVTNTGKTFRTTTSTNLGYPYMRAAGDGVVYVATPDSSEEYVFTMDGVFKNNVARTAFPDDVVYGSPELPWFDIPGTMTCCGEFGNSYLWCSLRGNINGTGLFVGSSGDVDELVYIGYELPSGVLINGVIISNDNQRAIIVLDDLSGAGWLWNEINTNGEVQRSGRIDSAFFGSSQSIGYGRRSSFATTLWCCAWDQDADTVAVMVATTSAGLNAYHIESDGSLTHLYAATLPQWGFYYPACIIVGETSIAVWENNFLAWGPTLTVNPVGLDEIVEAECLKSNLLEASDLDVTDLAADEVRGFRVSDTGPIRASLEPLSLVWPFDVRAHGYELQFVRRGGASIGDVPAIDLDARPDGAEPGALLTVPRDMDSELPQRVVLSFLDADREYDKGEQESARYNTDARNVSEIEVSVVLNATGGKQASEVLLYNYWRERNADITFNLPPTWLHLEPADVVTVTAPDASTHVLRLTNINYTAANVIECTARRDKPGSYISSAVAETGSHTGAGLVIYGPTTDALLDIPALTADGDTPGFYAAACGLLTDWPGAILFSSNDNGATWSDVATWDNDSVMGSVPTALGAATCFDRVDAAGTLTVSLYAGTISTVTRLQMLGGDNHFAYGAHGRWEIIAAQTATLNGDGTYTLQDFLRGRLGTEQYASTHEDGDLLVQLTTTETLFINRSSAQIGMELLYRPVTFEGDFDDTADEPFTYAGINLKPLSPVHLNGNRHPSTNDWTLDWVRRARINFEWRDYVDVPLDETSEAYEVEIWDSGYTTLKRTLTGITGQTTAYTSSQQVTDWGSNQATIYLKIFQLSATVGRGYPLIASITR